MAAGIDRHRANLKQHAQSRGITAAQFAVGWVLNNSLIAGVVAGPRTETQLDDYVHALDYRFTAEDEELVDKLVTAGHPVDAALQRSGLSDRRPRAALERLNGAGAERRAGAVREPDQPVAPLFSPYPRKGCGHETDPHSHLCHCGDCSLAVDACARSRSWNIPSLTPRPAPTANGWLWPTPIKPADQGNRRRQPERQARPHRRRDLPAAGYRPRYPRPAPGGGRTPVIPPALGRARNAGEIAQNGPEIAPNALGHNGPLLLDSFSPSTLYPPARPSFRAASSASGGSWRRSSSVG